MAFSKRLHQMISTIIFVLTISCAFSAPTFTPDFDNIQYAHNLNLSYSGGQLQGMDAIDSYPEVDSEMAQNLKDAINRAIPDYMGSTSSQILQKDSSTVSPHEESTGAPLDLSTPSESVRVKREDLISSTISSVMNDEVTTQPYGTDEEFYARTDLIHFNVNIDNEGSGLTESTTIIA